MKKNVAVILAVFLLAGYLIFRWGVFPQKQSLPQNPDTVPQAILNTVEEGIGPNRTIEGKVERVIDGDTVEVSYKGKKYKVRLLDVDTPESVKEGVLAQPYAREASDYTKGYLLNREVRLVFWKGLRDNYDRLLAYILLKDGTFFNYALVREGFARVETVAPNTSFVSYFKEAQNRAREEKKGFWRLPEGQRPFVKGADENYIPRYWNQQKFD